MINYNKLLKKMNNEELIKVVGTSAIKTIKKNGYIRMKTMEKICKYIKHCKYTCICIFEYTLNKVFINHVIVGNEE